MGSKPFGAAAALRAALLVTGSTYVAYAAGLVTSMLIARALGPADYGRYAYLVWLSGVLVLVMNNGLTTSSIRFVSECLGRTDKVGAASLHRWFWQRQWWSVAVMVALFVPIAPFVQPEGWAAGLWLMTAVVVAAAIPKAWYLFGISMAKGHGRFGIEATTMTALSLASAAGVIVLMLVDAGLYAYLALFVLTSLVHPVLLGLLPGRVVRKRRAPRAQGELLERVKPHYYWTTLLTFAGVFAGTSMPMLFLNRFATAQEVGYFSVAAALTRGGIELLSSGLNSVLMPLMAHGFGAGGQRRAAQITADASRMFHFFGLLLTGVGVLWARPMIMVMYGEKFMPAVWVFQALIIVGGLTLPGGALGTLLSTTDQQRTRLAITVATVLLAALASWWLVPLYGLGGALAALVAVTLASYVATIVLAMRQGGLRLPVAAWSRLTLAALCAGALSVSPVLVRPSPLTEFLAGGLFLVLYPLATVVLRAWNASDLGLLSAQAHRLGRFGRPLQGLQRWGARAAGGS